MAPLDKMLGPWPGNHGRLVTADLHQRCKSIVVPLRKTIVPCDVGPVTYFVVNLQQTLCILLELAASLDLDNNS